MRLFRRLQYWLQSRRHQADLEEEIEFHRSMLGSTHEFGNTTLAREDARAVWIWPWLDSILQDVRYALRNLRKHPLFAFMSILALGCAIGLNTSLFTTFEAIALRPWPVQEPRRLVRIFSLSTRTVQDPGFSVPEYRYLASRARSFTGMLAMQEGPVRFGFESFGKPTHAMFVDADHFRVLGIEMLLGRGFLPEEGRIESPVSVVVLSHAVWRDHFGSDPGIVGKTVRVESNPFTVIGVAPEQFLGTSQGTEGAWFPLPVFPLLNANQGWARNLVTRPQTRSILLAGRLAPGVSRDQARAELETLSRQFHSQFNLDPVRIELTGTAMLAANPGSSAAMPAFVLLFVGVTLILMLACANTGNLLLARAAARRREIDVRRALGASRARIIRQLLTESLVLALGAAGFGIAIAYFAPAFVIGRIGEAPPVVLKPDLLVLSYALGLAIISCLSFGLAPALHSTSRHSERSQLPLRSVLLASQLAMSIALLTGAALLFEGVQHARVRDPGFAVRDVTVVSIELPAGLYDRARIRDFSAQLMSELNGLAELPYAAVSQEPLSNSVWTVPVRLSNASPSTEFAAQSVSVSRGYFDLLQIPIVAGRDLEPADTSRRSIIINQAMARRLWNDADAVGRTILSGNVPLQVIGVVRDSYSSGLDRIDPLVYQPFGGPPFVPKVLVRDSTPGAAEAIAGVVRNIEKGARTVSTPLARNIDRSIAASRAGAQIAGLLGIFALMLATIGLSGVFAYVVQQRTKEIGIRMTLGARPKEVMLLILQGTARAVLAGLAVGSVLALAGAQLLTGFLYGVSPFAPRAYALVVTLLAMAGLIAALWPALRVTRVDPVSALRCE